MRTAELAKGEIIRYSALGDSVDHFGIALCVKEELADTAVRRPNVDKQALKLFDAVLGQTLSS